MKKLVLSAVAAAMVSSTVYAEAITLYSDPKTGQVFTTPGEGRVEMGDFIDAKSVDMANREQESKLSEYQEKQSKYVNIKSKAKTIEFGGTHYFGLSSNSYGANNAQGADQSAGFEMRRNYLQAKAYFNDTDYFRVTLDTTKELESTTTDANMYVKYAYLYLDKVLPYTGVEIGVAHRPWIDYEENNAWYYRSINKVVLEDKFSTAGTNTVGVDTMNSADLGMNVKTKTPYVSSELGLFNGEGYHSATNQANNSGMSVEWRLTGHLLGNGDKVGKYKIHDETYANISFAGLSSQNHKMASTDAVGARYNRNAYWIHAVYNQPEFLIAAQYNITKDHYAGTDAINLAKNKELRTWSVNGEYRPIKDWTVIARYDYLNTVYSSDSTSNNKNVGDATQMIYGIAYEYSKNIKFIASGKTVDAKDTRLDAAASTTPNATIGDTLDKQSWMLTTEVEW